MFVDFFTLADPELDSKAFAICKDVKFISFGAVVILVTIVFFFSWHIDFCVAEVTHLHVISLFSMQIITGP